MVERYLYSLVYDIGLEIKAIKLSIIYLEYVHENFLWG